mmetsp:Transcript_42030/g.91639  ORF Transcript_42030/g.91639 Transcript_42030/m.91639 type:complete len:304 (+) Transcript_42030:97-1008(+)
MLRRINGHHLSFMALFFLACANQNITPCIQDTGGTCKYFGCDSHRGPAQCVNDKCMCVEGYCAMNGVCANGQYCEKQTGGPCRYFGCDSRRNANCDDGLCKCGDADRCSVSQPVQETDCNDNSNGDNHCTTREVQMNLCVQMCIKDTGGSCWILGCNSDRMSNCENGRCICPDGMCSQSGICKSTSGCDRVTGGTCSVFGCDSSRGPTDCIGGHCICPEGYCEKDGACRPRIGGSPPLMLIEPWSAADLARARSPWTITLDTLPSPPAPAALFVAAVATPLTAVILVWRRRRASLETPLLSDC